MVKACPAAMSGGLYSMHEGDEAELALAAIRAKNLRMAAGATCRALVSNYDLQRRAGIEYRS